MRHVLLSNDDGVFAPGLRALADAFVGAGWRVTVAAPDRERSATAHSLTMRTPLVAVKHTWDGVPQGAPLSVWSIDGTPADCMKLGLHDLCGEKPDLVASGINSGWNVGTDVHYSGTVGAAVEGAFEGYPAIAVSAGGSAAGPTAGVPTPAQYAYAAALAAKLADRMLASPLPSATVLNLNLPNCAPEDVRGLVEAPMTHIRYTDSYDKLERSERSAAYWLRGEIVEESCTPGGDLSMLLAGYATMTVLGWDLTMPGMCGDLMGE